MVVCKYFMQGTCKFGTYCQFDHEVPSNYNNYTNSQENRQPSTSILRQNTFVPQPHGNTQNAKADTSSNVDGNLAVKSIIADMAAAEKGNQWILSCFAPFKDKPPFPGFSDVSSDEVRWGFVETKMNGTEEQYTKKVQALFHNYKEKMRVVQNPTPEMAIVMGKMYGGGSYGQKTTSSSPSRQSNNIFAINQNTSGTQSIFGATPQGSLFAGSPSTNIFASASPTSSPNQNNNNMFAGAANQPASNNIFANNASNIFATPNSNSSSVFGNTQPKQASNIFAPPPPIINVHQNMFAPQSSAAFQQQPSSLSTPNIFATPPPQAVQPNTNNIFAPNAPPPPQSGAPPNYSATIFGGSNVITNPSMSLGSVAEETIDESLYSKLEELGVEERNWFASEALDILNIPDKPPTYDMCFKA